MNESLSDIGDDFDHTIGLSPRSSTGGSLGNLKDSGHYGTPTTSTPEGHLKGGHPGFESDSPFCDASVKERDKNKAKFGSYCALEVDHKHECYKSIKPGGKSVNCPNSQGHSMDKSNSTSAVGISNSSSSEYGDFSNGLLKIDTRNARNSKGRKMLNMDINGHEDTSQSAYDACDGDDEEEDEAETSHNSDISVQLCQVQEMVGEMKSSFITAMQALAEIKDGDEALKQVVDNNKQDYEKQMADVLQMVLSLKNEFSGVLKDLHAASDNQRGLRHQVESLQYERDILLEELERAGVVSKKLREKYHSGRERPDELYHSQSSANLSGLLERARLSFQPPSDSGSNHNGSMVGGAVVDGGAGSQNSSHVTSDSGVTSGQVGDEEVASRSPPPPVGMSPMMDSYISQQQQFSHVDDLPLIDAQDDSDSSLTAAANKSLDLSRSLGDACADDLNLELSDDEKEQISEKRVKNIRDPETASCLTSPEDGRPQRADDSSEFKRPPTPPPKLAPHERNAKEVQRGRVARELVETERKYCSCLWTLLDHFAARLRDNSVVPNKDINQMFPACLTRIYEHHCAFLQKLEDRLSNGKWQCVIGDVVSRFIESSEYDLLSQYKNYMKDFPNALHSIRKACRSSTKFKKFLREAQNHPCCEGLDVNAFLLTPIQRMPRYVLLLKQLLKHTENDHPDHYFLDSCLERLGEFLNDLNDSIETSMKLVQQPEQPPTIKRRIRDRIPSFRRTNTADALLDTSCVNLDSSFDSSIAASSLEGRFIVTSPRTGRPVSVHGYPGMMLTSAQSLQAIPMAVSSQHDLAIGDDGAFLVQDTIESDEIAYFIQDRTGRIIPVKHRKVKRPSKADLKQGYGLSASFHGATRPHFIVGSSPIKLRNSSKRLAERPHSMGMESFPEDYSPVQDRDVITSTPSRKMPVTTAGYANDLHSRHLQDSTAAIITSQDGGNSYVMMAAQDRQAMPPPPTIPPLHTATTSPSIPYSPRTHGAHVHTNGSLSYHQNLRRIQNEYGAVCGANDSDDETDLCSTRKSMLHSQSLPQFNNQFNHLHGHPITTSSPRTQGLLIQNAADSHNIHYSQANLNSNFTSHSKQLGSQSVVDFNESHSPFKSQSAVDFRHVHPAGLVDSVEQHNINVALAQSLTMRDDGVASSNSSPVSMRSTHSHPNAPGANYPSHLNIPPSFSNPSYQGLVPPPGLDYKPQLLGNIDRPGCKLTSKRHSTKRYESPTPSRSTISSQNGGVRRDSSSNTSITGQQQEWHGNFTSASTSNLDTTITGSPRKDLNKKQQKERQKKLAAQSVGDLGPGRKTKTSIRQSLKNMFFRKKNSKTNGSTGSLLDSLNHTPDQDQIVLNRSYNDDDDSLVISNLTHESKTIKFSMDDSEEPCSAV